MRYLTNQDVMNTHPHGSVVYEVCGTTFRILPLAPAVTLRDKDAKPHKGILKKDFQKAHKVGTDIKEAQKISNPYAMPLDEFRAYMRTVGCGTTVFLDLADGLHLLSVQRSAPSTTPDGVVMPGAFSRAAGGATGDIELSGYRELTEECFIGIKKDNGHILSFDLIPDTLTIPQDAADQLLTTKHGRAADVFAQVNSGQQPKVDHQGVQAVKLSVPGLTQTVKQVIDQDEKLLENYVVVDNPENGDVSGVDSILFVSLTDIASTDLVLADGETDWDGNLLGRDWLVKAPQDWHAMLTKGEAKFSPAYEAVVKDYKKVVNVIRQMPLQKP